MKKIVVPYDFSVRSMSALKKAIALSKLKNSQLVVLHVVNITMFDRFFKDLLNLNKVSNDVRDKILKMLDSMEVDDAKVVVKNGITSAMILECAKEEGADLIILGDHGEFHLKDILLGTTARSVILGASIPVLVVKNDDEPHYKKVMANVDFSKTSVEAFNRACRLLPDAKFIFYHGYVMPSRMVVAEYGLVSDSLTSTLESIRQSAKVKAMNLIKDCQCKTEVMIRSTLSASEDILQIALEEQVDLIVLGAKSENAMVPFMLGSVTDSLLQHSFVDMLIFRTV